jgi:hypothetical protein
MQLRATSETMDHLWAAIDKSRSDHVKVNKADLVDVLIDHQNCLAALREQGATVEASRQLIKQLKQGKGI